MGPAQKVLLPGGLELGVLTDLVTPVLGTESLLDTTIAAHLALLQLYVQGTKQHRHTLIAPVLFRSPVSCVPCLLCPHCPLSPLSPLSPVSSLPTVPCLLCPLCPHCPTYSTLLGAKDSTPAKNVLREHIQQFKLDPGKIDRVFVVVSVSRSHWRLMFLEGLLGRPSSFLVDSRKNTATYKPCHKHMDLVSTAVWEVVHPAADCPFNHWATQVPLSLFPLSPPCPPPRPHCPHCPPLPLRCTPHQHCRRTPTTAACLSWHMWRA